MQRLVDVPAVRAALARVLVVDVLSVKVHPRDVLTVLLPRGSDVLCTHPMLPHLFFVTAWIFALSSSRSSETTAQGSADP